MRGLLKYVVLGAGCVAALLLATVSAAAPGRLDSSFGTGGKVLTQLRPDATDEEIDGLALQPDGKIVAAGYTYKSPNNDYAITRYRPNGSLDSSFGTGGKVTLSSPDQEWFSSVALQADGKIVAVGRATKGSIGAIGVVRFKANGSLDTSFGTGGEVATVVGTAYNSGYGIVILPDGKIVVSGYASFGSYSDAVLVKYNADGSLDTSFGAGGIAKTSLGGTYSSVSGLVLQPDGKLVASGYEGSLVGGTYQYEFAVVRFDANGTLDTSFGTGGKVKVDLGTQKYSYAYRLALQGDGKIVVSGRAYVGPGKSNFALVRLNSDGSLDPSFGSGGKVLIDVGGTYQGIAAVLIQRNRKIVAVGWTEEPAPQYDVFALARLKPNGSLDPAFGTGGKVILPFTSRDNYADDALLLPNGKILAGGAANTGTSTDRWEFALARFKGDTCTVPKLKGKKLAAAKRLIVGHTCSVGKVKKRSSAGVKRGLVLSQKPAAGTQVASSTPVDLVVGKGRHH